MADPEPEAAGAADWLTPFRKWVDAAPMLAAREARQDGASAYHRGYKDALAASSARAERLAVAARAVVAALPDWTWDHLDRQSGYILPGGVLGDLRAALAGDAREGSD